MTRIEKWAHVAEIAGVVAVFASLLYVGYEISRNTAVGVVETSQRLLELQNDANAWQNDLQLLKVAIKAEADYESLTLEESRQFTNIVVSSVGVWEHAFFSHNQGVMPDELWRNWNNGFCSTWPEVWFRSFEETINQEAFFPEFVAHVRECHKNIQ